MFGAICYHQAAQGTHSLSSSKNSSSVDVQMDELLQIPGKQRLAYERTVRRDREPGVLGSSPSSAPKWQYNL